MCSGEKQWWAEGYPSDDENQESNNGNMTHRSNGNNTKRSNDNSNDGREANTAKRSNYNSDNSNERDSSRNSEPASEKEISRTSRPKRSSRVSIGQTSWEPLKTEDNPRDKNTLYHRRNSDDVVK